jgi:hypothetical protein
MRGYLEREGQTCNSTTQYQEVDVFSCRKPAHTPYLYHANAGP